MLEKIDALLSLVGEHEFVGGSRERTMVTALETGSGVLTLLMDCLCKELEVPLPLQVELEPQCGEPPLAMSVSTRVPGGIFSSGLQVQGMPGPGQSSWKAGFSGCSSQTQPSPWQMQFGFVTNVA